jgi:hypothetical protein
MVNSHHHQGIRELPANLRISARSRDGLIEAVEHTGKTCVLGIQWQRWLDKCSDAIMKQFLAACEHYRFGHNQPQSSGRTKGNWEGQNTILVCRWGFVIRVQRLRVEISGRD